MNPYAIPPIVAGIVAIVIALTRRLTAILVSGPGTPSAETLTLYTMSGRFASFLLVYGLVLGLAYWAAGRRDITDGATRLALATGVVGAVGHLVGIGVSLQLIEPGRQDWLLDAVFSLGTAVAVGVQLAVVAFAGAALARRRSRDDSTTAPSFDRSPASRSD